MDKLRMSIIHHLKTLRQDRLRTMTVTKSRLPTLGKKHITFSFSHNYTIRSS